MRYLLAILLAAPVLAQSPYFSTSSVTGFCRITSISTANPAVITIPDNRCGLSNGAVVYPAGIRGATAFNIRYNDASDTDNRARKVTNLTGSGPYTFNLTDMANNAISGAVHASCSGAASTHAGNCAYTGSGRISLAAQRTRNSDPVLHWDGPSGTRTLEYADATAGGKNTTSNPMRAQILADGNLFVANNASRFGYEQLNPSGSGQSQSQWQGTANALMRCILLSDSAACAVVDQSIGDMPDKMMGGTACDIAEPTPNCGSTPTPIVDYSLQYGEPAFQAFSHRAAAMSSGRRANFIAFFLGDGPWMRAGHNYTASSLTEVTYTKLRTTSGGTMSWTTGGSTFTGLGTSFTTQCAVGGIITPYSNFTQGHLITAIPNDLSITLDAPHPYSTDGLQYGFSCQPRWDATKLGALWFWKHMLYNTLNGSGPGNNGSGYAYSPYYSTSGAQDGTVNHSLIRTYAMFGLGTVTCPYDPRGCWLATDADEWMQSVALPAALSIWTPDHWNGETYRQDRIFKPILRWVRWRLNSWASINDPLPVTLRAIVARAMMWFNIPRWNQVPTADYAWQAPDSFKLNGSMQALSDDRTTLAAQNLQWFLYNVGWYNQGGGVSSTRYNYGDSQVHGYGAGAASFNNFLVSEPRTTQTQPGTTAIFNTAHESYCAGIYGASECATVYPDVRRIAFSRTSWTDVTSTYVAFNGNGIGYRDHNGDTSLGAYPYIFKNMQPLLGTDGTGMMGIDGSPYISRGYVLVGSASNLNPATQAAPLNLPMPWSSGSNNFMHVRSNIAVTYKAAAHVSVAERQFFHLKSGSQDFTADHAFIQTDGTPMVIKVMNHLNLNGCGTPASTTCVDYDNGLKTFNHTHTDTGAVARLACKVYGISGTMDLVTENGGNDFRYTGGLVSARIDVQAAAGAVTEHESVTLCRPVAASTGNLPTITPSTSGSFRTFDIAESGSRYFLAFTRGGATASSLAITTAATTPILAAGLTAGTYYVHGVTAAACQGLVVVAGEQSLFCPSATAGSALIDQIPPSSDIGGKRNGGAVTTGGRQ